MGETDISVILNKKISEMSSTGQFEALISAAAEQAVKKSVDEAFSRYSDFSKSVENALKENIKVDIGDLGIGGYNDLVAKIIKSKLGDFFEKTATKQICESMDLLLKEFPSTIKTSEIADMFRKRCAEENESGEFTFILSRNESIGLGGYFDIYLDEAPGKDKYQCAYHIRAKPDVWAVSIGGMAAEKKMFMGPLFDFERFLFHAYANKVVISVDDETPSTFYGNEY